MLNYLPNFENLSELFGNFFWQNFDTIEIAELCKGVHCVDLGESFQTHIFLQNLASIQPRTSPLKFACCNDLRRAAGWSTGPARPERRRGPAAVESSSRSD